MQQVLCQRFQGLRKDKPVTDEDLRETQGIVTMQMSAKPPFGNVQKLIAMDE
jgi:hypothetical protein